MRKDFNTPKAPKQKKSDSPISEKIQEKLVGYLGDELEVDERNNEKVKSDFKDYYNMIHCVRETKPNEWESDIFLPDFVSRLLTQIGNFVSRYFSSRDYVEPDMDSEDPIDIAEGKASKKLLNAILNDKRNHYYQKIVRILMFAFSAGYGVIKGGYSQKTEKVIAGYKPKQEFATNEGGEYVAEDGTPFKDPYSQRPKVNVTQEPVYQDQIIEDRPIFDVYPIQNVRMSAEYAYSLNEKEHVTFDTEKTLDELRDEQELNGYFNLDLLEEDEKPEPQKRNEETSNQEGKEEPPRPVSPKFVIYERWGKFPCIVKEGEEPKPGMDENGDFKDNTENLETIMTYAKKTENDTIEYLIGFRVSKHSRRPMVRFMCYVDPLKDEGFGDGEIVRELQVASNDNYNLMNYRSKLATTLGFKAKRWSGIDENVRVSPDKAIMLENMEDLQEFKIQDDIQGGIYHQGMLTSRMDYAMATSPQTMGMEAERKETATQASIMKGRSDIRIGMKAMNLEFIGFTDFYDMLLTLCNDFMLPQTLEKMIGEYAFAYNPGREDKFKPVSQALETEEGKSFKIKMWDQVLGRVVGMAQTNPKAPMAINFILGQIYELMGGSFKSMKKFLMEDDPVKNAQHQIMAGGKGQGSTPNMGGGATQNQSGLPQGMAEGQAREASAG